MRRVKGLRAALRQCVGACARSAYPRGSGGRSPRRDRGQRGSRGAAAPAPQAPAGRGPAGANEGRGEPQPRPERRKGAADDPAERGRGLHKTRPFVGDGGGNPARRPPARRRGRGKPAARQFGPGPRVKRPRPELNKRGVLFKGREAGGGDPRKPPVGPRPVSAPGVPGRSWSGALRLAEATALPDPPQAAQEGQVWGGTAWCDTPEIVVTERDNPGGVWVAARYPERVIFGSALFVLIPAQITTMLNLYIKA